MVDSVVDSVVHSGIDSGIDSGFDSGFDSATWEDTPGTWEDTPGTCKEGWASAVPAPLAKNLDFWPSPGLPTGPGSEPVRDPQGGFWATLLTT